MDIDTTLLSVHNSLSGKEYLIDELVAWLRSKELSVRQSRDLLESTIVVLDDSWRTESYRTKL